MVDDQCRVKLRACPMNMRGYFFRWKKKQNLKKNCQACPMNMLGNLNHVFFLCGWKKISTQVHRTCVEYFFRKYFFFKAKNKNHACLKTYVEFLIKFVKLVNHHTSPMNILGFLPIPKLGLNIRAFSAVMRNTLRTTQTKRYTVRKVNRRRPLRVDSTLSAGPFICWHMTVKQSTQELLCLW